MSHKDINGPQENSALLKGGQHNMGIWHRFKVLKEKNPVNLEFYSQQKIHKESKIMTFSDKQKLSDFVTSRPTPPKNVQKFFQRGKRHLSLQGETESPSLAWCATPQPLPPYNSGQECPLQAGIWVSSPHVISHIT